MKFIKLYSSWPCPSTIFISKREFIFSFSYYYLKFFIIYFACVGLHSTTHVPKSEESLWESFSPSTMWIPGIELRSSDLAASFFTYWVIPSDSSFKIKACVHVHIHVCMSLCVCPCACGSLCICAHVCACMGIITLLHFSVNRSIPFVLTPSFLHRLIS